jgi:hypothetical protein
VELDVSRSRRPSPRCSGNPRLRLNGVVSIFANAARVKMSRPSTPRPAGGRSVAAAYLLTRAAFEEMATMPVESAYAAAA